MDEDLDLIFKRIVVGSDGRRSLQRIANAHRTPPPTSTAKGKGAQQSPRRAATSMSNAVSPHRAVCTYCNEERDAKFQRRMRHIIGSEATERSDMRGEEANAFEHVVQEHRAVYPALARQAAERAAAERSQEEEQAHPTLSAATKRALRKIESSELEHRRIMMTEQIASFDDVAAFLRLTLRQSQQASDVKARSKRRLDHEESERARREEAAEAKRSEEQLRRCTQRLEAQETARRTAIAETEVVVIARMLEVALAHRRDIRQHEARVEAMLQKHGQRHEQLDAEIAKVLGDEVSNRERHIATERKAFESTICMEPDLRKRAQGLNRTRLAKEAEARTAMGNDEQRARNKIGAELDASVQELTQTAEKDRVDAVKRQDEREVLERRTNKEDTCAAQEAQLMLECDNQAWAGLRLELEEEAIERCPVPVDELEERHRIDVVASSLEALARHLSDERRLLELISLRQRSQIRQNLIDAISASCNDDASAGTLFQEYEECAARFDIEQAQEAAFALHHSAFDAAAEGATLAAQHAAIGRHRGSSTPGAEQVMWCDVNGIIHVLRGCNAVSVSNHITVRTVEGERVTDPTVKVEMLNSCGGDTLTVGNQDAPDRVLAEAEIGATAIGFRTTCSREMAAVVRVIRITANDISIHIHVHVHESVVGASDRLPTERLRPAKAFPLKGGISVPAIAGYKSAKISLSSFTPVTFSAKVAEPYAKSKSGMVTLNGKSVCKQPKVTSSTSVEVEFELSKANEASAFMAATIEATLGDAWMSSSALPVTATLTLLSKSDDYDPVSWQQILPPFFSHGRPMLSVEGNEVAVRSPSVKLPPKLAEHLPQWPHFFLHPRVLVTCADSNYYAVGGGVSVRVDHGTLDIQGDDSHNFMMGAEDDLLLQRSMTAFGTEPPLLTVGTVTGRGTGVLDIRFVPDAPHLACLTAAELSGLFHAISITPPMTNETAQAFEGKIEFVVDCDGDVTHRIEESAKLLVLPSLLRPVGKGGVIPAISFTEGGAPKHLPAMSDPVLAKAGVGLGAQLRVEIISGFEADELSVADEVTDRRTGLSSFRHKNQVVASWQALDLEKGMVLHVTGAAGLIPTRDGETKIDAGDTSSMSSSVIGCVQVVEESRPYAPYKADQWADKSTVSASALNVLLRSVAYQNQSENPQILKKLLRVTLDDGRTGRSSIVFEINIESVDDPTELEFTSRELQYTQFSKAALGGYPIMPGVQLEDPDSDNFHRGFMSIEITGGGQPGDTLTIMSPTQQAEYFEASGEHPPTMPALSRILRSLDHDDSFPTLYGLPFLAQQQTAHVLRLAGDRLFFRGEQIATLSGRTAVAPSATEQLEPCRPHLRLDFFSDTKFIDFATATYILQCIAFDTRAPKIKPGARQITVKLTCGTAITTEVLTVHVQPALVHPGAPSSTVHKVEEAGKPKVLLPQATGFLSSPIQHQGFLHATIVAPLPGDEINFEAIGTIKVKEKSVYCGKELAGVIQQPRTAASDIYLIFAKLNSETLTALMRSLCYSSAAPMVSGTRTVSIRVCGEKEADGSIIDTVTVDVPHKQTVAPTVKLARPMRTHTQGASDVCRPLESTTMAPSAGKPSFLPGCMITVKLMRPALVAAESLFLQAYVDELGFEISAHVLEKADGQRHLVVLRDGVTLAKVAMRGYTSVGGRVGHAQELQFVTVSEMTPQLATALLGVVAYDHRLRGVRGRDTQVVRLTVTEGDSDPKSATPRTPQPASTPVKADAAGFPTPGRLVPLVWVDTEVNVLPPLLDASGVQRHVQSTEANLDPVSLFAGVRVNVAPNDSEFVDVEVRIEDGSGTTDVDQLALDFDAAPGDLVVDGEGNVRSAIFADGASMGASALGGSGSKPTAAGAAGRSMRMPKKQPIGKQWPEVIEERIAGASMRRSSRSEVASGAESPASSPPTPAGNAGPASMMPEHPKAFSAKFSPITNGAEAAASAWLQAVHLRALGPCPVEGRDVKVWVRVRAAYAVREECVVVHVAGGSVSFAMSQ